MAWHKIYDRTLTSDQGALISYNYRMGIAPASYSVITPDTGTKLRITVQTASSQGAVWDHLFAGHRNEAGDVTDMDSSQVEVLASTSQGGSLSANSTFTLDDVNYSFDKTKGFVASVHFNGSSSARALDPAPEGMQMQWAVGGNAGSDNIDPAGTGNFVLFFKTIEVFSPASEGPPTVEVQLDPAQIDPSSGHAVRFNVVFNKAVTGFTGADVDLSSSTAGGTLSANVTMTEDTGQLYAVEVTGMTTNGTVAVKINAGVATDGTDTNTASNTMTMDWDLAAPPGELAIHSITMAAPDVICVAIRDKMFIRGALHEIEPTDASYSQFAWTGPIIDGRFSGIVGPLNEDGLKTWARTEDIQPVLADYLVRDDADDKDNWTISGGVTIEEVYRESLPYAAGFCKGHTGYYQTKITVSQHDMFIKLAAPLENGSYLITPPGVPAKTFVFDDETTRAMSMRFTQNGHRPNDIEKRGYVSVWIPGAPNEGQIDVCGDHSLDTFYIRDSNNSDVFSGPITLRLGPTTAEENLYDLDNNIQNNFAGENGKIRYMSTTNPPVLIKDIHIVDSDQVVVTTGTFGGASVNHGLSEGELIMMTDLSSTNGEGPGQLQNVLLKANNVTATTFGLNYPFPSGVRYRDQSDYAFVGPVFTPDTDIIADASKGGVWEQYGGDNGLHHYIQGKVYKTHVSNRAGTYVYECDYSGLTADDLVGSTGPYHAYIPTLGNSDNFRLDDNVWYDEAHLSAKGEYHHRVGIELDGRFGWSHPANFIGVSSPVYESYMPYFIGDLSYHDVAGGPHAPTANAHKAAWSDQVPLVGGPTGVGGSIQDAGDYVQRLEGATVYGPLMFADIDPVLFQNADFGRPKCHEILDPTVYGTDTNGMPDMLAQGIFQLDVYRRTMKTSEDIWKGSVYSGLAMETSTGTVIFEPSWLYRLGCAMYAPEIYSNFIFAGGAAKIAQVCYAYGYNTIGDMWKDAALLSWEWSRKQWDSFFVEFTNPGTGYSPGNILTVSGGTRTVAATITVISTGVGGAITSARVSNWGNYTVFPSTPATFTGGDGSGATGDPHFTGEAYTFNFVTLAWPSRAAADTGRTDQWSGANAAETLWNMTRDAADGRRYAAGCLFRITSDVEYEDVLRENVDIDPAGLSPNGFMEYVRSTDADPDLKEHYKNAIRTKATINFLPFTFGATCYKHGMIKNYGVDQFGGQGGDMGIWEQGLIINAHQISLMDDDPDDQCLIALQANLTWRAGANGAGLTHTTGLGVRNMISFMPDIDATGEDLATTPIGISCYGFGPPGNYKVNIFNFGTGAFSFIVESPDIYHDGGSHALDFELQRTIYPYRYAIPIAHAIYQSMYCLAQRERTIQQCVVPNQMAAYYLSSWDGNDASGGPPPEVNYGIRLNLRLHSV